jgi:hypothetical protein
MNSNIASAKMPAAIATGSGRDVYVHTCAHDVKVPEVVQQLLF